jgi:amidase
LHKSGSQVNCNPAGSGEARWPCLWVRQSHFHSMPNLNFFSQSLHGIPFLVKDTFVTRDQMDTTAGSYALAGARYEFESTIMTKLRGAGAIILGKTNMSEWGMSRSSKCKSGWSAIYGQAVGGFYQDQDPQGSSSGSAIATSLGLASFTIGGEVCIALHTF